MQKRSICLVFFLALLACLTTEATAGGQQSRDLDREFQAAVAQYDSGHYAEAAAKLENLVREAPESFEVQELLGLVYSAESQDARATQHLQKAVHLKPDSAPARTNLAANLERLGKLGLATEQFKRSEEHTSELQSQSNLVCRLLLEKKKPPDNPAAIEALTTVCRSHVT